MDDNDSNSSYNPSIYSYKPTNAETTPSQRIINGKNMSEAAKKHVDKASWKHCLIENTAESNHIDYAHCLRRSTKGRLLDKLKFAWNMERFTLNVDTRYNIFCCMFLLQSFLYAVPMSIQ
ncbi:hypothetical protein BYT27DRAFT_7257992 [Phlegmacium glaucopus]|nr:hypothetical protein BYT27DRAFT_7257992 [Phlegmacium glaucopus]